MHRRVPAEAPIVIAHRGASGYLPEHTLAAYFVAVEQGADYIEPDLVMTRDGVPVVRHENEIGGTTDVATHAEFADRRRHEMIDGVAVEGWFVEDFTLAELKCLRARERLPELRPGSARFDGHFEVPTFGEVLGLVRALDAGRAAAAAARGLPVPARIGVYPETKHPTHFARLGLAMEATVLQALRCAGYRDAQDPVFIQSFELGNLRELRSRTEMRLIQLLAAEGAPWDLAVAGDPRTFADLLRHDGLREIATYADGIGVARELVLPRDAAGALGTATSLVTSAHEAGLQVHVWTLRAENAFLPSDRRLGAEPSTPGDLAGEVCAFLDAGVDGFFTDHPLLGVQARDRWLERR